MLFNLLLIGKNSFRPLVIFSVIFSQTLKAKKSTLEEQIEALRNDFTSKTHALEKAAMEREVD